MGGEEGVTGVVAVVGHRHLRGGLSMEVHEQMLREWEVLVWLREQGCRSLMFVKGS